MISKKIMDKRTALSILKQKHVDLTQQFEAGFWEYNKLSETIKEGGLKWFLKR